MGRGGAENPLAAGGPEVPGLQGRALRAWSVLPTFVQTASEVTPQPPPRLVVVASGGELSGGGPGAPRPPWPTERPAPWPQHKAVSGLGCPDSRVELPGAWPVSGELSDWSSSPPLMVTAPFLGKEAGLDGLSPTPLPQVYGRHSLFSLTSAGRGLGTHGGMYKPTAGSTADCTP